MKGLSQEAAERCLTSKTVAQGLLQGRVCATMEEFRELCKNLRGKGLITAGITGRFELTVQGFGFEVQYNSLTNKLEVSET